MKDQYKFMEVNKLGIELGDEVKDSVSGFKGTVVATHTYLHGCTRFSVCSKSNKGAKPEVESFDEPQLIVVKKKKIVKKGLDRFGGPNKYIDAGKIHG